MHAPTALRGERPSCVLHRASSISWVLNVIGSAVIMSSAPQFGRYARYAIHWPVISRRAYASGCLFRECTSRSDYQRGVFSCRLSVKNRRICSVFFFWYHLLIRKKVVLFVLFAMQNC